MKKFLISLCLGIILSPFGQSLSAAPIPYSGKVAINGANFQGDAPFTFALRDADGTIHWRNGVDAESSVTLNVDRGLYICLLGGSTMNDFPENLFLQNSPLFLVVHFFRPDIGEWLHLQPDQLITSAPHALAAEVARNALTADAVKPGAITKNMLAAEVLADLNATVHLPEQNATIQTGSITRSMLAPALLADLNRSVVITRSMLPASVLADLNRTLSRTDLPADVLADLNRTIVITRDMLPGDVLADLNRTVVKSMLGQDVLADLNRTITKSQLGNDVLNDLNATITRSRLAADVLADINATISRSRLAADVLSDLNGTISRSRLAADILEDLNAGSRSLPEARSLSLSENSSSSFSFHASDPDGDALTYSISGPDAARFSLNVATGEISFANPPDFENPTDVDADNRYALTLTASDGSASTSIDLSFTVSDLAESPFDFTQDLVAYYPFDGNASDMSGNGNHGTVKNGLTLSNNRFGLANKAYSFDGVDDYVELNNASIIGTRSSLSIFAWVQLLGDDNTIYGEFTSSSDYYRHLFRMPSPNTLTFDRFPSSSGSSFEAASIDELGVEGWHLVGITQNQDTRSVFVDGKVIKTSQPVEVYSGPSSNIGLIGARSPSNPANGARSLFSGSLDDVRIYDRALSAAEVAALYHMERALPAGSVTTAKLAPELRNLLDGNGTVEQALPAGSVIAVKPGDPAPAGYTLFQRNEYNATLTWEEKAPVSVARYSYHGVEAVAGKIYFIGGANAQAQNIAEHYDPKLNQWETLSPVSLGTNGMSTAVLNGKLYAIGMSSPTSVEIFDPSNEQWTNGTSVPDGVDTAAAINVDGKILLIGGNVNGSMSGRVLEFDPATSQWTPKANMPTPRGGHELVLYNGEVWSIGGSNGTILSKVESYDPKTDSWKSEASLTTSRNWASAWVANGRIFVAGGYNGSFLSSVICYDPTTKTWVSIGNLPENKYASNAVVFENKVYLVAGQTGSNAYSKKVFAADLPPPAMDLYFKDGNATAEAATAPPLDGNLSVTLNMLAPDTLAKLDVNQTHAQSAGSVIAVPRDAAPLAGYTLYKRSDRNSSLVWEEKAPVSVARFAHDGVEALNGKIYFMGGGASSAVNTLERYDPATNQWEALTPMSVVREGVAAAALNGKIYVIGGGSGSGLSSVEIYDPNTAQWSVGPALPSGLFRASAINANGRILLFGGRNSNGTSSQVQELDPSNNQWVSKASMLTAREGHKVVLFNGKAWVIGGESTSALSTIEIYDIDSNSWSNGPSLTTTRLWPNAWVADGKIFVSGGRDSSGNHLSSIEIYDPANNQWQAHGTLPEAKYVADATVLDGKVYIVSGGINNSVRTNKVFAADITPPMDLYFRDANASGSVALPSLSAEVLSKLDGNASALPPVGASLVLDANGTPPVEHAFLEGSEANATLSIPARNLYFREVNATQPEQPSENRPPKFSDEDSEVADNSITTAKLADGAVTTAKLSPQVRSDLNATVPRSRLAADVRDDLSKTVSRPFGASLANPYGILGTPIVKTTNYTVPGGKVLVITSSGGNVMVNSKHIRLSESHPSIVPSGTTVTNNSSNLGWTGFLIEPLSGITPIVKTTNYTVPGGKVLVITSSGDNVMVNSKHIRSGSSPPSIISSGTTVTNNNSSAGWTGYLLDPTQFE